MCGTSKWVVKQLTKKAKVNSVKTSFPGYGQYRITSGCAPQHGNADVLREKWKSILHHVTIKQKWSGYNHFHECCHSRLTTAVARKKKWLKPDTPAYIALEEVVLNKKLLKDI